MTILSLICCEMDEKKDESMHSGADVEAFTAALNRDIEGDASASHLSHSNISKFFFIFLL